MERAAHHRRKKGTTTRIADETAPARYIRGREANVHSAGVGSDTPHNNPRFIGGATRRAAIVAPALFVVATAVLSVSSCGNPVGPYFPEFIGVELLGESGWGVTTAGTDFANWNTAEAVVDDFAYLTAEATTTTGEWRLTAVNLMRNGDYEAAGLTTDALGWAPYPDGATTQIALVSEENRTASDPADYTVPISGTTLRVRLVERTDRAQIALTDTAYGLLDGYRIGADYRQRFDFNVGDVGSPFRMVTVPTSASVRGDERDLEISTVSYWPTVEYGAPVSFPQRDDDISARPDDMAVNPGSIGSAEITDVHLLFGVDFPEEEADFNQQVIHIDNWRVVRSDVIPCFAFSVTKGAIETAALSGEDITRYPAGKGYLFSIEARQPDPADITPTTPNVYAATHLHVQVEQRPNDGTTVNLDEATFELTGEWQTFTLAFSGDPPQDYATLEDTEAIVTFRLVPWDPDFPDAGALVVRNPSLTFTEPASR